MNVRFLLIFYAAVLFTGCKDLMTANRPESFFSNPLYIGADPWVYLHTDGFYYYSFSDGKEGIAVWKSKHLTNRGSRHIVWNPPLSGWNTSEIWAPEIHFLEGKWYIYYAADSGENKDHQMGVLEAVSDDPQGPYIDKGMLYTGDYIETRALNRWAIDGTPLEMNGRLYFVWSGWQNTTDEQWLYIAEMENPWTIKSNRIRIADNDNYIWEHVGDDPGERGLNEGPEILKNGVSIFLIYSASGSWLPTYKLGQLSIHDGDDPLNPSNWRKRSEPVFRGNSVVHGVGHASFTKSPDGTQDWILYHSKIDEIPGWGRDVRLQRFRWNDDESPYFGEPVLPGDILVVPSGES